MYFQRSVFGGNNFRCWLLVFGLSGAPHLIQFTPLHITCRCIAQPMTDIYHLGMIQWNISGETFRVPHTKRLLDDQCIIIAANENYIRIISSTLNFLLKLLFTGELSVVVGQSNIAHPHCGDNLFVDHKQSHSECIAVRSMCI